MEDKIILKFKTKNILNFYEIEPRSLVLRTLAILISMYLFETQLIKKHSILYV